MLNIFLTARARDSVEWRSLQKKVQEEEAKAVFSWPHSKRFSTVAFRLYL
jgi:hypothetical protein